MSDANGGRVIAYKPAYARLKGTGSKPIGVEAALLLCQVEYWTPRTSDPHGWFYKTADEWEAETGLTQWQQETVRRRLVEAGLIEIKRMGKDGKLHYRLHPCAQVLADCQNPTSEQEQKGAGIGNLPNRVLANRQNGNWQIAKTGIGNLPKPLIGTRPAETETTAEITPKTTTEIRRAPQDSLAHDREARAQSVQAQSDQPETAHSSKPPVPPRETRQERDERQKTEAEAAFWAAKTVEHGAEAVVWVKAALLADIASGKRLGNKFTIAGFKFDDWTARQAGQNQTGAGARASPAPVVKPGPTEAEKAEQEARLVANRAMMAEAVARVTGGTHDRK